MNKKKIKFIASILELIIICGIYFYLLTKIAGELVFEDMFSGLMENLKITHFSNLLGSPGEFFNKYLFNIVKPMFNVFLNLIKPIFKIFSKFFKQFQNSINMLRNLLKPIREFIKMIAKQFYDNIQKFIIGIVYSLNKMRNTMKRSVSGFNLLFHTLEHSKNTMSSMINSPPVKLAMDLMKPLEWLEGQSNQLFCFSGNQQLWLFNNRTVTIKEISIGDILLDGSVVIATHKFINTQPIYLYKNKFKLTALHRVFELDKWVYIKDSPFAHITTLIPQYVYCISTNTGIINISGHKFKDYSESHNIYCNKTINSLILNYYNGYFIDSSELSFSSKYLEHGFSGEAIINTLNGNKKISAIRISDILLNDDTVLGIVELNPKFFKFYLFNNIIVSSNMKVFHDSKWVNIEMIDNIEETTAPATVFHIITESGYVYINNHTFLDYLEIKDEYVNNKIDEIIDFS
tara:strand:- start:1055 stop:2434 length:1380 start_codon:yes stop_codon:yes gene_type:complete